MARPFVTIAMPALNEERYVAAAIASVMPDRDAPFDWELVVADGGSCDATAAIVESLACADARVRLVANPGRSQAAGVNLVARIADAGSNILVRADCHATYPPGFVAACVEALASHTAAAVVVPMRTVGVSCAQRAIAAAQNSLIGNGGAAHRRPGGPSRPIDHGHHAAFRLEDFLQLGGYDESFKANEDAELDVRMIGSGRGIWLCDEAAISYHPRATLPALATQYCRYGAGRAATVRKTGTRLKLRQALPLVSFLACILSLALSVADGRWAAIAGGYYVTCLLWGLVLAARERRPCPAAAGLAAIVMHHAWAIGFLHAMATNRHGPQHGDPVSWAEAPGAGRVS